MAEVCHNQIADSECFLAAVLRSVGGIAFKAKKTVRGQ